MVRLTLLPPPTLLLLLGVPYSWSREEVDEATEEGIWISLS